MLIYAHTPEKEFFIKTIMIILKNNAVLGSKTPIISSIFAGAIAGLCLLGIIMPQTTTAGLNSTYCLIALNSKADGTIQTAVRKIKVVITAYSSTPEETDSTPFITASGKNVRDGIIANNLLPFGTKIRIPSIYGDKVFVVEDRMNKKKNNNHFDIWFPSKNLALNFGVKTAEIEVLQD